MGAEDLNCFTDTPLWVQVWEQKALSIVIFAIFLFLILLLMFFKDQVSKHRKTQKMIKYGIWGFSFAYVGLSLKAQPTTTNIVILLNSLKEMQFPLGLFLLEPYIFLSFTFIVVTVLLWGRGVFCGWLCPYGMMLELFNKFYQRFLPKVRLTVPPRVHDKLIYLKYFAFLSILGVSFYNFILAEYLTEVEPFRTFVLKLNREWYFVLYFMILTGGSLVVYRAFCRYLCPLGAALSLPSFVKGFPLIKMKRYDFCRKCRICAGDCAPQAIGTNGGIDTRECIHCLDCQVNYWDADVCPVLIKQKREAILDH